MDCLHRSIGSPDRRLTRLTFGASRVELDRRVLQKPNHPPKVSSSNALSEQLLAFSEPAVVDYQLSEVVAAISNIFMSRFAVEPLRIAKSPSL